MSLASLRSRVAASPHSTHCRIRAASRRLCRTMALPDQFVLKDKTVVVTGASRGIGLEVNLLDLHCLPPSFQCALETRTIQNIKKRRTVYQWQMRDIT